MFFWEKYKYVSVGVIFLWNWTLRVTTNLSIKAFFAVVAAQRQAVIHSHKGEVCGLDQVQASCLPHPLSLIYGLGQSAFLEI